MITHLALAWNCFHSLAGLHGCALQCFHRVLSVTRVHESSHFCLLNEPSKEQHAILSETLLLQSCSCNATAPPELDSQMRTPFSDMWEKTKKSVLFLLYRVCSLLSAVPASCAFRLSDTHTTLRQWLDSAADALTAVELTVHGLLALVKLPFG